MLSLWTVKIIEHALQVPGARIITSWDTPMDLPISLYRAYYNTQCTIITHSMTSLATSEDP